MDLAVRAMISGFGLEAPAERICPFNEVIPRPLLFEPRSGQILPDEGARIARIPFEGKPGLFRGDNESVLFLFALPDFSEVEHLHFDFPNMCIDFGMRDERIRQLRKFRSL